MTNVVTPAPLIQRCRLNLSKYNSRVTQVPLILPGRTVCNDSHPAPRGLATNLSGYTSGTRVATVLPGGAKGSRRVQQPAPAVADYGQHHRHIHVPELGVVCYPISEPLATRAAPTATGSWCPCSAHVLPITTPYEHGPELRSGYSELRVLLSCGAVQSASGSAPTPQLQKGSKKIRLLVSAASTVG